MGARKIIDWDAQPLGKLPDKDLALQLGVPRGWVTCARNRRGIANPVQAPDRGGRPKGSVLGATIDWAAIRLGQDTDAAIARQLGVHTHVVAYQRKQRGIPPVPDCRMGRPADPYQGPAHPARAATWAAYPRTMDICRCCSEAAGYSNGAGRYDRRSPRRWTDQGPLCWAHYEVLPACARCPAPVLEEGDLCEGCTTELIRRQAETTGWRSLGYDPTRGAAAGLDLGTLAAVQQGLRTFERRRKP